MFNDISRRYDFLNHFLSLGIDIFWRKRMIDKMRRSSPRKILDVATGTGDLAIEARRLGPEKIIGVDIAERMLRIARKKIISRDLGRLIVLIPGDSEALPFSDLEFDAVMVAFGVRNFDDLMLGLSETRRVLKTGGRIWILELSKPRSHFATSLYYLYFKKILPLVGRMISRDRSAYSYLPDSVEGFPSGEEFLGQLKKAGFEDLRSFPMTFGVATVYCGMRPGAPVLEDN